MCGIAGAVTLTADAVPDIQPMLSALRHRGPDGEGAWSDRHCALGQRRLAIIDLSEAGQGPIPNEDGTVWLTFNGEIYNFKDLRRELEASGHRFRSNSDTEVIVHAYEQWGEDSVQRLRGMFAFAIWDQREKRLLLARDRVGKKPLFYTFQNNRLLFASELQGLLTMPEVDRAPDPEALQAYLSWGYIPAPLTGFKQIRKLEPGHYLQFDVGHAAPRQNLASYWQLHYKPKRRWSSEEAEERVRDALAEAVRIRLVSDVPLGAFLSGGIDSSIIVALMALASTRPVKTFSIGFEDEAYNELAHARRVAQRWGTDHHEEIVRPDAAELLPLLARHYGEPFADSSAIPTYYVSQMTRKEVTVALNGDGGDECFGGYDRYRAAKLAANIGGLPGLPAAARVAHRLSPPDPKHPLARAARFFEVAGFGPAERYAHWMRYFGSDSKAGLCTPEFLRAAGELSTTQWFEKLFSEGDGVDPAEAAMAVDMRSYLPYDLLVKVDIASMANSLEARSPFLDHHVLELAALLPPDMKLTRRTGKVLLKDAFNDLLPPENMHRAKMGFGVPVGDWFRGALRDLLHDALLSKTSLDRGYFNEVALRDLIEQHQSGVEDHGARLWNLLMLEMWHREVVDAPASVPS